MVKTNSQKIEFVLRSSKQLKKNWSELIKNSEKLATKKIVLNNAEQN